LLYLTQEASRRVVLRLASYSACAKEICGEMGRVLHGGLGLLANDTFLTLSIWA
jgi:hypothetical protein